METRCCCVTQCPAQARGEAEAYKSPLSLIPSTTAILLEASHPQDPEQRNPSSNQSSNRHNGQSWYVQLFLLWAVMLACLGPSGVHPPFRARLSTLLGRYTTRWASIPSYTELNWAKKKPGVRTLLETTPATGLFVPFSLSGGPPTLQSIVRSNGMGDLDGQLGSKSMAFLEGC